MNNIKQIRSTDIEILNDILKVNLIMNMRHKKLKIVKENTQ